MNTPRPSFLLTHPTLLALLLAGLSTVMALPATAQGMTGHTMHGMGNGMGISSTTMSPVSGKPALSLSASNATIVAVPASIKDTSAFMVLRNTGKTSVQVTSASASIAGQVMLMNTIRTANMTGMVPANGFKLTPGSTLTLKADGAHLMLMGLKRALKVGEVVPVVLRDGQGHSVTIKATIKKP